VGNLGSIARLAALALVALTLAAEPASALKGYSAKIKDTAGDLDRGKVKCGDKDEFVVSGGFSGVSSDAAVVNRAAGGNAWLVKGDFALPATAYANCSKHYQPKVAKKTSAFNGNIGTLAEAHCSNGRQAVAGGWQYKKGGANSPVYTSAPAVEDWEVGGFNGSGNHNATLTAYAYCLNVVPAVTSSTNAMGAGGDVSGVAECDPGEELLGGGFETTPDPDFNNVAGPDPFVFGAGRAAKREWLAEAHNYSSVGGDLHVFATCLP
jgi:hypothetical protein